MSKKKKGLIDLDEEIQTGIVSTVRLQEIKLKDLKWMCKLGIGTILPKSYHNYKIIMDLDEQPYLDRIFDLENQNKDSLFKNDRAEKRKVDDNIKEVRKQLAERQKECEHIEFNATVEELKYKDSNTVIVVRVPDDVIEPFNRQKSRFVIYKIVLEPIYV